MRLNLVDPFWSDLLEALDAVGGSALPERHQSRDLRLVERHDQLAAMAVGDAVFIREAFELSLAFSTQSGLEGSRGVVEARVQHARVVAGLMEAELGFLLNHCHTQGGL